MTGPKVLITENQLFALQQRKTTQVSSVKLLSYGQGSFPGSGLYYVSSVRPLAVGESLGLQYF